MLQKGAIIRVVEGFVHMWKDTSVEQDDIAATTSTHKSDILLNEIDHLGKIYGAYLSRQSDRNCPRTKFRLSLFSKNKKNGHEHAGVLYDILCAILSNGGCQIVKERGLDEQWLENYVYLIEHLLQFEQFMKTKKILMRYMLDEQLLRRAMDHLLFQIDNTVHRGAGTMGNNVIKNHLLLHLPHYASRWGPLTGMDLGDSERNHKTQVKPQSKWTQRREYNFQEQFGKRWHESRLVTRAVNCYWRIHGLFTERMPDSEYKTDSDDDEPLFFLDGSEFEVGINANGQLTMGWIKNDKRGRVVHPQPVLDYICNHILCKVKDSTILGRTEAKINIRSDRQIFRAHPNYRSDSDQRVNMWYDWAMFERTTKSGKQVYLPGHIAAFVIVGPLRDDLTGEAKLREGFFLLLVERIVDTAIVVPNVEADEECKVECPEPLDGGFFVLPSHKQLGEDFFDVIECELVGIHSDSEGEVEESDDDDKKVKGEVTAKPRSGGDNGSDSGSGSKSGSDSKSESTSEGGNESDGDSDSDSNGDNNSDSDSNSNSNSDSDGDSDSDGSGSESGRGESDDDSNSNSNNDTHSNSDGSRDGSGGGTDSHGSNGLDEESDDGQVCCGRLDYLKMYKSYFKN